MTDAHTDPYKANNGPDRTHSWRYGSSQYPAPNGIRLILDLRGFHEPMVSEHVGRIFYKFSEGYFSVHDPANGGYAVNEIERGLIKRIEIEAF